MTSSTTWNLSDHDRYRREDRRESPPRNRSRDWEREEARAREETHQKIMEAERQKQAAIKEDQEHFEKCMALRQKQREELLKEEQEHSLASHQARLKSERSSRSLEEAKDETYLEEEETIQANRQAVREAMADAHDSRMDAARASKKLEDAKKRIYEEELGNLLANQQTQALHMNSYFLPGQQMRFPPMGMQWQQQGLAPAGQLMYQQLPPPSAPVDVGQAGRQRGRTNRHRQDSYSDDDEEVPVEELPVRATPAPTPKRTPAQRAPAAPRGASKTAARKRPTSQGPAAKSAKKGRGRGRQESPSGGEESDGDVVPRPRGARRGAPRASRSSSAHAPARRVQFASETN
ncbi:unnamed protein product [Caenorhabditis brenneri]